MARIDTDGLDALRYALSGMEARVNEGVRRATKTLAEELHMKARGHGAYGSRYLVQAVSEGQPVQAVLICPALPTRRRSAPLSRYDRLAPPIPDDTAWS